MCYWCNYPSVPLSPSPRSHRPSSLAPFIIQSRGLRKVGHTLEQELLPRPLNKVESMHSRLLILKWISIKIPVVHILISGHLLWLSRPWCLRFLSAEWPRKWGAHSCFRDTYVYVFIRLVLFIYLFIGEYNMQTLICVNEEACIFHLLRLPSLPWDPRTRAPKKCQRIPEPDRKQLKTAGANKYSDS